MRSSRRPSAHARLAARERSARWADVAAGCGLLVLSAAILAAPFILCAIDPAGFRLWVWGV